MLEAAFVMWRELLTNGRGSCKINKNHPSNSICSVHSVKKTQHTVGLYKFCTILQEPRYKKIKKSLVLPKILFRLLAPGIAAKSKTWHNLNLFENQYFLHCRVPRIKSSDGKL
jgi:hypothetical protein